VTADPHVNGQRIYYIRSAVEAIATKLGIELNFYGEPVQADALTGPDQVSDVSNSRHGTLRDIPTSVGGPAATPAMARAAEAYDPAPWRSDHPASLGRRAVLIRDMHRAMSAALHDPDDPGWLARTAAVHSALRTERFGIEPDGWYCDGCGALVAPRDTTMTGHEVVSEHLRAVILLGARGEEVSGG